jgi:UDP-N-acetyl-D-mannosaminuronate dehydrogenase
MNIGFLGLGKLGLPVALAIESKGHRVLGTDINDLTFKKYKI